jgi:hypothetical protein
VRFTDSTAFASRLIWQALVCWTRDTHCGVWIHWKQELRNEADEWLNANKEYKPDAIPAEESVEKKVPVNADGFQGYGGTGTGASTNAKPHQKVCWTAVKEYRNNTSASDMHYPDCQDLDNTEPIGNGRSWALPAHMSDRSKVLKLKNDAKYTLRAEFFPENSKNKILTNHFEYTLNTDEFYEYEILDLGTKNRKKLGKLMQSAINNWPFLQQNQTSFATNWIDTIIAWKPLYNDLKDRDNIEGDAIEWGPHSIPLGNNPVTARFRFVKTINTHGLH